MRRRQPPIFWVLVFVNLLLWLGLLPARLLGVL
jgi:hypothetical protein